MVAFRFIHFQILFNFLYWIFYTVTMIYSVDVKYIGCYIDDEDRMLDGQHFSRQLTLEVCTDLCHGHRYLGLQSYSQCYCGNSLGDTNVYKKKNEDECDRACKGDSSQICGGHWLSSVYELVTATLPTTTMTTEGHSAAVTVEMTTHKRSVTTAQLKTRGLSEVTTTDMTTDGHSSVVTAEMTTNRQSMTTAEIIKVRQSKVTTTDMTIPGKSSVTSLQTSKHEASKVTTTAITTLGRLDVTTTDIRTPGQLSVTTLQVKEPKASEVTTLKTTPIVGNSDVNTFEPISPLQCLCPCSKVVIGKWNFLRGMNLTLDQLREVMKPELDLMKKELSVNKYNTTRMRRSKMSAPDDRVSATSVGYVGVIFICLITVLIVFIDILGCSVAKLKRRSRLQI